MEEINRYPDIDMAEGILRIISSQVLDAVGQIPSEEIKSKRFLTL